jgi:hypothetical protein
VLGAHFVFVFINERNVRVGPQIPALMTIVKSVHHASIAKMERNRG